MNCVRAVVEAANSIFHEIHHENDYGNDAFIELVDGEEVTGICVGVQIKAGTSYCTDATCRIPYTEKQRQYWANHSLGVLGIVFDPAENAAYWTELKAHCKQAPGPGTLVFEKTQFRRFDLPNYSALIVPRLLGRMPRLTFELACRYAASRDREEHSIGLRALLYGHHDVPDTWSVFHRLLTTRSADQLDPFIVYALAHIPWHGDMSGPQVESSVRQEAHAAMADWSRRELEPLILLIGDDDICRGSIGQSVYAIVDLCVSDPQTKLHQIAFDQAASSELRRGAFLLLSYVMQEEAVPVLELGSTDSVLGEMAGLLKHHLSECGFFGL